MTPEREFVLKGQVSDEDLIRHYISMLATRHRKWPLSWDITVLDFGKGAKRLRAGADVADYASAGRLTRCTWARYMDDYGAAGDYFRNKFYNITIHPGQAKRPSRSSGIVIFNRKAAA